MKQRKHSKREEELRWTPGICLFCGEEFDVLLHCHAREHGFKDAYDMIRVNEKHHNLIYYKKRRFGYDYYSNKEVTQYLRDFLKHYHCDETQTDN